jgi:hypothetical protein
MVIIKDNNDDRDDDDGDGALSIFDFTLHNFPIH